MKSNSTFIDKCIDSLALKSKRNGQNPLPGYPNCAHIWNVTTKSGVFSQNQTKLVAYSFSFAFWEGHLLSRIFSNRWWDEMSMISISSSTRERVGYSRQIREMACFFSWIVISLEDFIRSRKQWFSIIILREMREKYLFFREPWFWLCLLLFSTVANNAV